MGNSQEKHENYVPQEQELCDMSSSEYQLHAPDSYDLTYAKLSLMLAERPMANTYNINIHKPSVSTVSDTYECGERSQLISAQDKDGSL